MTTPTDRPRVLAYCRVSTEEQVENGVSMAAQEERVRAYADAHGLDLLDVVRDNGVSARTVAKRAGLQRILHDLRAGQADGVVVAKLDRLSRTTRDVLDLVARADREGWQLHSIQEHLDTRTSHGRFVVTVLAGLAQMEREQTSERTKAALAHLRRQGRRTSGRPPFGFRFEAGLEVGVPAEQEVLRAMLDLRAEGLGARRIARELAGRGAANPRSGRPFTPGTVQAIVRTAERRSA
ncbi:MAG: recombinase family protein [Planctomycetota bacterium]|jgi:DNA invertase Pin-like site-specific DNA recombinase